MKSLVNKITTYYNELITEFLMCFKQHRELLRAFEYIQVDLKLADEATDAAYKHNSALAVEIAVLKSKLTRKPKVTSDPRVWEQAFAGRPSVTPAVRRVK